MVIYECVIKLKSNDYTIFTKQVNERWVVNNREEFDNIDDGSDNKEKLLNMLCTINAPIEV